MWTYRKAHEEGRKCTARSYYEDDAQGNAIRVASVTLQLRREVGNKLGRVPDVADDLSKSHDDVQEISCTNRFRIRPWNARMQLL